VQLDQVSLHLKQRPRKTLGFDDSSGAALKKSF